MGGAQAQDYLISFNGSGASTTVESVKVENITQGTVKTLSGNDILHLVSVVTDIDQMPADNGSKVIFYPNPVITSTRMKFYLPSPGETAITVYDITGKKVFGKHDNLSGGEHRYFIEGLNRGVYFVTINSGRYSISGSLISNESHAGYMEMTYESTLPSEKETYESKGSDGAVAMQYNPNDRLIFTATGGESIATVSYVPTSNSTITFDFYPCKDGDNNKYPTVKIGTQTWMAANLRTTKFNNGDPIPLVTDDAAWLAIRYEPAYCWYDNDESTYKNLFGALYNYWTVSRGDLCPAGWHVPTWNEFMSLQDYLINNGYNYDGKTSSGNEVAKSLASTSMIILTTLPTSPTMMWNSSTNTGAIGNTDFPEKRNASGFSALPSGFRGDGFSVFNRFAFWWTSTDYDMVMGRYRNLQTDWSSLLGSYTYKWAGYSVRCLKDF